MLSKLKTHLIATLAMGVCMVAVGEAQAVPILVSNFNFATPSLANGGINVGAVPGWTKSGGTAGNYNPDTTFYNNPQITDPPNSGVIGTMDDPRVGFLFQSQNQSLTNTTSYAVVPGEKYQLTVAVGERNGSNASAFGGWKIELLDGDSVLAVNSGTTAPAALSFGDVSLTYTAVALDAGFLRIRLSEPGTTYADYDNVRLDATPIAAVPEPASLALLSVGLASLVSLRMRRRKR